MPSRHILVVSLTNTVLGLLLGPLAQRRDSGLVLLPKMQRALGSAEKLAAIRDLDTFAGCKCDPSFLQGEGPRPSLEHRHHVAACANTRVARQLDSQRDDGMADISPESRV